MKKMNLGLLLTNALPIIIILGVLGFSFDWMTGIKVAYHNTKMATREQYINDFKYDIKIDYVGEKNTAGVNEEYILINIATGNLLYVNYTYNEDMKKVDINQYRNYVIKRVVLNYDTQTEVTAMMNRDSALGTNSATVNTAMYTIYYKEKLRRTVYKSDTDDLKIIETLKAQAKELQFK